MHRRVPGAVSPPPARRPARQARPAPHDGRRRRRRRAGRRLAVAAARRPRRFHARLAAARRRRRRRRRAAARAVPRGRRAGAPQAWLERWRGAAPREDEVQPPGVGVDGRARAERMRQRQPLDHPAQPSRRGSARRRQRRHDDLGPFERLLEALRRPFDETAANARLRRARAAAEVTASYRTFCGT